MAAPNRTRPAPLVIEYPQNTHGRDLPTAGLPSPLPRLIGARNRNYALLQRPTVIDGQKALIPLPNDLNTCFRDAALTLLFALKPFMIFLDSACPPGQTRPRGRILPSDMIMNLARLAHTFWDTTKRATARSNAMKNELDQFWTRWLRLGHNQRNVQADVSQFLGNLLAELAMPAVHVTMPDSTILFHFFQSQFNLRYALECNCARKERLSNDEVNRAWTLDVSIRAAAPDLGSATSMAIYTHLPDMPYQCPTCGSVRGVHEYRKFRVLPEVLFVNPIFVDQSGAHDPTRRCEIPEALDLTQVQDKPLGGRRLPADVEYPEDKEDARSLEYQLQGVIDYQSHYHDGEDWGHYRCHVRRNNDVWDCLDTLGGNNQAHQSSLNEIANDMSFQPRILAYVRKEQPELIAGVLDQLAQTTAANSRADSNASVWNSVQQTQQAAGTTQDIQNAEPTSSVQNNIQSTPPPLNSGLPSGDTPANPTLNNGAPPNSNAASNNWTVGRFKTELDQRGIHITGKRDLANYRTLWQAYQNNPKDYNLYKNDTLRNMLTSRAIEITKSMKRKTDYVSALQNDDLTAASNLPTSAAPIDQGRQSVTTDQDRVHTPPILSVLPQVSPPIWAGSMQATSNADALQRAHDALLADYARITTELQTLRANVSRGNNDSVRIENGIRSSTSRPTMLLASITVRGRTDRFFVPLPLYHFVTWVRPTSLVNLEDSGSVRVVVHLVRQDIDQNTGQVCDRDVILRVDGQGFAKNVTNVTVELQLITARGPLDLNNFRSRVQTKGNGRRAASASSNNGSGRSNNLDQGTNSDVGDTSGEIEEHEFTRGRSSSNEVESHDQPTRSPRGVKREHQSDDDDDQHLTQNTRQRLGSPSHENPSSGATIQQPHDQQPILQNSSPASAESQRSSRPRPSSLPLPSASIPAAPQFRPSSASPMSRPPRHFDGQDRLHQGESETDQTEHVQLNNNQRQSDASDDMATDPLFAEFFK